MSHKKPEKLVEPLEVMVARIDERVEQIHKIIPVVSRHDKEILVAKVMLVIGLVFAAAKYPAIADAVAGMLH